MTGPSKVLFVAWRDLANPLAGGSEVLVDHLACGLAAQGHEVSLLCAGPTSSRTYAVHQNGGRFSQYLRAPISYLRHFRDVDLVVDVANGLSFFVPLWRRLPSVCLVNHLHSEQWRQWFPLPVAALGRSLERYAMPLAYRRRLFVAVSESTAASLEEIGVDREHIRIVHNGTDLPRAYLTEDPEPLFVCLGRLVPHKRIEVVLAAWERVRPLVGGQLMIIGEGPERSRLEALAGQGVTFTGEISEEHKNELLGRAWLLLHPAMVEGWGLVVLEAAARRTPTVAFDVPGLRDSVLHAQTGMLATSEAAFLEHWVSLSRNPSLRRRMGWLARDRAGQFSWSASVERFLSVAKEAMQGTDVASDATRGISPSPTTVVELEA
ncbi:MAG: glycosyltransferase family 4 protein [Actinomycetota bacterium]|nr:glycosyltransferase family 4 protein [Actinomycetota bacterium]